MLSCHSLIEQHSLDQGERICAGWGLIKGNGRDTVISENETPTVRGLAADNNNKLYTESMIFLWNNHYNLNFIM